MEAFRTRPRRHQFAHREPRQGSRGSRDFPDMPRPSLGLSSSCIDRFSRRNVDEDFTIGCDLWCDDRSGGDRRCRRCDGAAIGRPRAEGCVRLRQCMRDNGVDDFPTRGSRRTARSISTPPPASATRSWRRPEKRASTSSGTRGPAPSGPAAVGDSAWEKVCLVATASVPMAASSPSGSAAPTRPRSCCSSKEVARVGTPKRRTFTTEDSTTYDLEHRRMRSVRYAAGSSTGPIRTTRSPTTRSSRALLHRRRTPRRRHREYSPSSPSSTTASSTAPRR